MRPEDGRAHYLETDGEAVFAVLHEPSDGIRTTAVLMIPPFGWEESSSYRGRRAWATLLAENGFAVLRFDLPGTGDSAGGPGDEDRVHAWLHAIGSTAAELRSLPGCTRVAAIGLGLGGLLGCVASSAGAPLDELVLWATPSRGRSIVRELKAFASLEESRRTAEPPVGEGALTVNGFFLSAQTAKSLSALDVRATPPRVRRALLLDRDGLPVDEALDATLVAAGADVSRAVGTGYNTLMAEPQLSSPPVDVMAQVSAWLGDGIGDGRARQPVRELATSTTVTAAGTSMTETLMTFDLPDGPAFGVLTEPPGPHAPLCAVLLNAGGIRRIGPNRMWVEAARRWAALGVPTLRVDLASIGDAGGPNIFPVPDAQLYEARYGLQVRSVFDALAEAGLPPRIFLAGLCSGAYWAFQVGQVDDRVAGAILLNPMALVYDPFQWTVRRSRFAGRILRAGTMRRVLRGEVPMADTLLVVRAIVRRAVTAPARLPARVAARRKARQAGGDELDHELDRLRDNGPETRLVFSGEEPLFQELAREGRLSRLERWPNVRVHMLDGPPGAHMLQPLGLQKQAHAHLDAALEALLRSSQTAVSSLGTEPGQ